MKHITALLSALLLAGCASVPVAEPVDMVNVFDIADHTVYAMSGTSTITGQGFLRQKGGGVVTCAGGDVRLVPATSYFLEVVEILGRGEQPSTPLSPEAQGLVRLTQCDAQGNFAFSDLPIANFVVLTSVTWSVGYVAQGGDLRKTVATNGGSTAVLLTDSDVVRYY